MTILIQIAIHGLMFLLLWPLALCCLFVMAMVGYGNITVCWHLDHAMLLRPLCWPLVQILIPDQPVVQAPLGPGGLPLRRCCQSNSSSRCGAVRVLFWGTRVLAEHCSVFVASLVSLDC